MALDSLTADETAMLDLEAKWFQTASGKEDAIRQLGMTPVRYYQLLNRLISREAAAAAAPVTVHRLRRIATQRARRRASSTHG